MCESEDNGMIIEKKYMAFIYGHPEKWLEVILSVLKLQTN